jgi:MOSC domain-containing protein YiiM
MTDVTAIVTSIQVGLPRTVQSSDERGSQNHIWTTGFFKDPTTVPLWLGRLNLEGDAQADHENHGGPDKAVNVYPAEHYSFWAQTIGLANLQPGGFGENFTIEGLLENDVCIGDVFAVGESLVQISQPRQPCWKLARRWQINDLALRVQNTGRSGWYFRVLREGRVQAGTKLILVERHHPNWTVSAANEVMHHRTRDRQAAQMLADCIYLSSRWRDKLKRRALNEILESTTERLEGPESRSPT